MFARSFLLPREERCKYTFFNSRKMLCLAVLRVRALDIIIQKFMNKNNDNSNKNDGDKNKNISPWFRSL